MNFMHDTFCEWKFRFRFMEMGWTWTCLAQQYLWYKLVCHIFLILRILNVLVLKLNVIWRLVSIFSQQNILQQDFKNKKFQKNKLCQIICELSLIWQENLSKTFWVWGDSRDYLIFTIHNRNRPYKEKRAF